MITSMLGIQHVGTLAGPLIGGILAITFGLEVAFLLQGGMALLAVIPGFLTQETAPGGRPERAGRSEAASDSFSWKSLLAYPIPVMFLAQWLGMTARGGIVAGSTVFVYAAYAYDADPATLGVLSSLMAGAGIPLTLSAGYLMDRFGRKVTVVPGLAVLGTAMAFLGITSFASLPFSAFIAGFIVLQTMNSLLTGSWQVIGSDLAPPGARGRFFAAGRTVTQAGFVTNPAAFSLLTALSGFTLALSVIGAAGLLSSFILGAFVKETHQR
jgi:MFS family permease